MIPEPKYEKQSYIQLTKIRWNNAKIVIQQISDGEWEFNYNPMTGHCCNAIRLNRKLWVGNGGWFVDVDDSNAFGLIFRHYVWWAAARRARLSEDAKHWKSAICPDLSK